MKIIALITFLVGALPLWAGQSVLLTGFDPFGGSSVNNSWTVAQGVQHLLKSTHPEIEVTTCLLPTSYSRAIPALEACVANLASPPTLILSLGSGPCNVKWETRAHNLDNDRGPDNDGASRKRQVIDPRGPREIGLRMNYGALWCQLTPAEKSLSWISTDPENFVCNNTAYRFTLAHPNQLYSFVHVPSAQCERRFPGITERAVNLIAKMISLQLSSETAESSSAHVWPTEDNQSRLPTSRSEIRDILRLPLSDCERNLFSRWRGDF